MRRLTILVNDYYATTKRINIASERLIKRTRARYRTDVLQDSISNTSYSVIAAGRTGCLTIALDELASDIRALGYDAELVKYAVTHYSAPVNALKIIQSKLAEYREALVQTAE